MLVRHAANAAAAVKNDFMLLQVSTITHRSKLLRVIHDGIRWIVFSLIVLEKSEFKDRVLFWRKQQVVNGLDLRPLYVC